MQSIQNNSTKNYNKIALICPECGSSEIIRNREGFNVCENCGSVLNILNIKKRPRMKKNYWTLKNSYWQLQNRTTIGTKQERGSKYEKALWHSQSESDKFQDKKTIQAYQEVNRLCSCLDLSDGGRDQVLFMYDRIRNTIQKSSLGQQIPVVIPVILYRVLKSRRSLIPMNEINSFMKCSPKQFRRTLVSTYHNTQFASL